MAILLYPLYILTFWYVDVIKNSISIFVGLNRYVASLLSINLLLRTFFKPLKNEYRKGLVLFSILSGIFVKLCLVSISIFVICFLLIIEVLAIIFLVLLPPFMLLLLIFGRQLL